MWKHFNAKSNLLIYTILRIKKHYDVKRNQSQVGAELYDVMNVLSVLKLMFVGVIIS